MKRILTQWFSLIAVGGCVLAPISRGHAATTTTSDYEIGPHDSIAVTVFQEADLSKEFRVSGKGDITYPLLNTVKVAGLTAAEAEKLIRKRLMDEDFMVDPQVTVTVKDYRKRIVTVLGQVVKPGPVEMPAEQKMTLVEAISMAGGLNKVAKQSGIMVTRAGEPKPVRHDWDKLQKTSDPDKIVYVEPNDIVFVEERVL